jgi:hypothetical protein
LRTLACSATKVAELLSLLHLATEPKEMELEFLFLDKTSQQMETSPITLAPTRIPLDLLFLEKTLLPEIPLKAKAQHLLLTDSSPVKTTLFQEVATMFLMGKQLPALTM